MAQPKAIAVIAEADIRRFIATVVSRNPRRLFASIILFAGLLVPFALMAYVGGILLSEIDDPLLSIRAVFAFTAISSFTLGILVFSSNHSNIPELTFLLLTPVKIADVVIAKLISVSLTLGFFFFGVFMIFLLNFSLGNDMTFLFTGMLAMAITLFVSFSLANLTSLFMIRFLKTSSNKRLLRVLGLMVMAFLFVAIRMLMSISVKYLRYTKFIPPSWGADLMLLRTTGMLGFFGYAAIGVLALLASIILAPRMWSFDGVGINKDKEISSSRTIFKNDPAFIIAEKELKTIIREPEVMVRVVLLFVFFALWPLLNLIVEGDYSLVAVPYILVVMGSTISMVISPNALGIEAGRIWILRSSPLKAFDIFFGKWFLPAIATGPLLSMMIVFYLIAGWMSPLQAVLCVILACMVGLFTPAMAVGISFMFPDFQRAKRNRPGVSSIVLLYLAAVLSFLPAIISLTYTFSVGSNIYDMVFYNTMGLGITAAVAGAVSFRLYRKVESIYYDLETVQGNTHLT